MHVTPESKIIIGGRIKSHPSVSGLSTAQRAGQISCIEKYKPILWWAPLTIYICFPAVSCVLLTCEQGLKETKKTQCESTSDVW